MVSRQAPPQAFDMMNLSLKSLRDEAQGSDPHRWADPEQKSVDLTGEDNIYIRQIDKSEKGPDYKWLRDPFTNEFLKQQPFSIYKMLAEPHVFESLFIDGDRRWGVRTICVEIIEPGKSYDHKRTLNLKSFGHYPKNGEKLPVWEWVLIREDHKRIRFRCDFNRPKKTFACVEWKYDSQIAWVHPPSTGPGMQSKRKVDGPGFFKRSQGVYYQDHGNPPDTGGADSSAGGTGTGGGGQPPGSGGDGQGGG